MIKYVKGDLFKAPQELIGHGCNCRGGFGSGIAGIMSKIHPLARNAYLKKFQDSGWKLGEVQFVKSGDKWIANCATQDNYGNGQRDGNIYADYKAIKEVMIKLKAAAQRHKVEIAIPKIGAGLAAGDWSIIEKIINEVFTDSDIYVYHID